MQIDLFVANHLVLLRRSEISAFRLKYNEKRCILPTQGLDGGLDEGPAISSREPTPARDLQYNDSDDHNKKHRVRLTFEQKPKDPAKGYAFGMTSRNVTSCWGPEVYETTAAFIFISPLTLSEEKDALC